uniref:Cyclin-A2 n=1 Tax=Phallusia mammillata TaxID=59560 RepID=A0A6F9D840_9ASCI|nr:cyclin-A2 [Phallusia mammillata]
MVLDSADDERLNIFDIDADAGVYGLSEYATEIFQHLRQAEQLHRPKTNYMRKQQDITAGMRAILVDWLVEVADEYKLHTETTHLAINYIDRFLSQMAVLRGKLQLVGAAAMFLAAKFEEIYPPDVGEFVYITDDTYTKRQVLRMEHLILKVLNFDVAVPTSNQYLKRYLKAAGADKKTEFLAQYLCELALVEFDCIQYLPSMMAASAVCLASYTVNGKVWDETMEHYMQYELQDLVPCIKRLSEIFTAAESHPQQALREKYKDAKYDCVSKITAPTSFPFDAMDADSTEEC